MIWSVSQLAKHVAEAVEGVGCAMRDGREEEEEGDDEKERDVDEREDRERERDGRNPSRSCREGGREGWLWRATRDGRDRTIWGLGVFFCLACSSRRVCPLRIWFSLLSDCFPPLDIYDARDSLDLLHH
ncbi:hypothetical protein AAC387_Pa04g1199 [Persea americana]